MPRLDKAVMDRVASVTGVTDAGVLCAPLRDRGMSLGVNGAASEARALAQGVLLLTGDGVETEIFWRHAAAARDGDGCAFWTAFMAAVEKQVAAAAGGEPPLVAIDWTGARPRLLVAGAEVTPDEPPSARVADRLQQGRTRSGLEEAARQLNVDADISMRSQRTVTARALMCGVMAQLTSHEVAALARLHTHTPEPELDGKEGHRRLGDACPKCKASMYAGHHRVCCGASAALTATHHAIRDVVAAFLNGIIDVEARVEVRHDPIMKDGVLHMVRADVLVDQLMADGSRKRYVIEVKTFDPRCATWRGKDVGRAEKVLLKKGVRQYATDADVRVLAVGADGTIGPKARALIGELINLRDEKGARVERDDVPDLSVSMAAALARCEAASYKRWSDDIHHFELAAHTATIARAAASAGTGAD